MRNSGMHLRVERGYVRRCFGPLSKLVDEADSKSAAVDPASRFESGEGHVARGHARGARLATRPSVDPPHAERLCPGLVVRNHPPPMFEDDGLVVGVPDAAARVDAEHFGVARESHHQHFICPVGATRARDTGRLCQADVPLHEVLCCDLEATARLLNHHHQLLERPVDAFDLETVFAVAAPESEALVAIGARDVQLEYLLRLALAGPEQGRGGELEFEAGGGEPLYQ